MPGGIGGQVESFLSRNTGKAGELIDTLKDKADGFLNNPG